jgi:pyruvate/2-oxoglutarate/acetoin dehydrogenase E1 component
MRTLAQTLGLTLAEALARDERVVLLGDEILDGGLNGVTEGLLDKFGPERVLEPGGGEAALVAFAMGAALHGLRPVVELTLSEGLLAALGPLAGELASCAWRTGDTLRPGLVLRCPYGAGVRSPLGALGPEALLCHLPGLAVAVPSDPASGRALLELALAAERPVVLLEPRALYHRRDLQHAEPPPERLGKALLRRPGTDATALCWGALVPVALQAAERLAAEEISVEVLDLLSLAPLDERAVIDSIWKTGRPVVVHEATRTAGFGAELAALIADQAVLRLEAPIRRVAPDGPTGFASEARDLPGVERVAQALREAAFY